MTLLERLSAATGADRELDMEIAVFIGWGVITSAHMDMLQTPAGFHQLPPEYTELFDSARSLIPPQFRLELDHYVMSDDPAKERWRTFLTRHHEVGDSDYLERHLGVGRTPEIAICIASLRARGLS